jgi:hypothetical protein
VGIYVCNENLGVDGCVLEDTPAARPIPDKPLLRQQNQRLILGFLKPRTGVKLNTRTAICGDGRSGNHSKMKASRLFIDASINPTTDGWNINRYWENADLSDGRV